MVMADHENDFVSGEGVRAGQDRYHQAACLCGESCLGDGYSGLVRLLSVSISHRFQERVAGIPGGGLAAEAFWAGVPRSAEADQFDCGDPVPGEKAEGWYAAGDLSQGRAPSRRRDKAISPGSFFSRDQGAGGYCAGGTGGNLRTPANGYLPHQVPPTGDARWRADLNYWTDDAGFGSCVGQGEDGD